MSWSAARPISNALDRLENGMAYRLVLIIAPQGSGKTRLLNLWMRMRSENGLSAPAMLSLEAGDNGFTNFIEHAIAAFSEVDLDLVSRLQAQQRSGKMPAIQAGGLDPSVKNAVPAEEQLIDFINAIAELHQEIAFVMDGYHNIESLEVHQATLFLINHLPANIHVYLASRSQPPLRIAHLRARREMIEIGPHELFTEP
jgi:ATP/maltotriose-dependent transcriptional regulator MalT